MKKIKRLFAALLLAALTLTLTACGSKLEGKWTLDVEAMKEAYGTSDLISAADMGVDVTMEFADDHKVTIKMTLFGGSEEMQGAWKTKDDQLIMTVEDDTQTLTWQVKGKKLTLTSEDGETMILKRK